MRQFLKRHPDSDGLAEARVEVDATRLHGGSLALLYTLTGTPGDVRLPAVVTAARSDELWQHTCFEAFVRASAGNEYYEFNFSPSTQWAAYRFNAYRSGMRVAAEIKTPPIEVQSNPDRFTLNVLLVLDCLSDLPPTASWRLGLSALIEDSAGRKSYWALAHPPGKPDFHHADCFIQELSPTVRP